MSIYRQMVSQVGRPVQRIATRYTVITATQTRRGSISLIRRRRMIAGLHADAWMIVRSAKRPSPSSTLLRGLEGVLRSTGRFRAGVKMRDPRTWYASEIEARAAFDAIVQRGGR